MNELAAALFLSAANYAVVNYLADPIRKQYPDLDLWWFVYVSYVTGAALSLIAGTNLFSEYIANETAALFVTALAVGGGSNLLYQIFGSERPSNE
jgi:hypothetical protein